MLHAPRADLSSDVYYADFARNPRLQERGHSTTHVCPRLATRTKRALLQPHHMKLTEIQRFPPFSVNLKFHALVTTQSPVFAIILPTKNIALLLLSYQYGRSKCQWSRKSCWRRSQASAAPGLGNGPFRSHVALERFRSSAQNQNHGITAPHQEWTEVRHWRDWTANTNQLP